MTFKRRWLITLFRTDSTKTLTIGLPTRVEWILIGVSALVLVFVVYILFWVVASKADVHKVHTLEEQNRVLQERIDDLRPQLDSVRTEIKQMTRWQDSLNIHKDQPVLNGQVAVPELFSTASGRA